MKTDNQLGCIGAATSATEMVMRIVTSRLSRRTDGLMDFTGGSHSCNSSNRPITAEKPCDYLLWRLFALILGHDVASDFLFFYIYFLIENNSKYMPQLAPKKKNIDPAPNCGCPL